ncbi:hypothetical protein C454_12268 [Haloferax gibbonsii ATCC 33959]|uniref:Uncharacterized protein n=1 Tax=Haloferax gibbonsii (strain ATCC 33959 / DSM 4427 / JCM 8863 / NBRC 102184 / NCIMB 2188 / Ma 2.38) TaxID=1227459 RepID=M0H632_HALGM|nr:hypothetical protein [Haloferax gibbonsii]ELZ79976.1 hypothetical protein C454_12268 [Haloferax gibbonsii ATCC 33959]
MSIAVKPMFCLVLTVAIVSRLLFNSGGALAMVDDEFDRGGGGAASRGVCVSRSEIETYNN